MARAARKQLADMRALEVEASRENIIDPRRATTEEMLTEEELAGRGATPSMGLSVVRGGAKHHEAEEAGRKLREYLTKLHGHGYAEAFAGGCGCTGGHMAGDLQLVACAMDASGGGPTQVAFDHAIADADDALDKIGGLRVMCDKDNRDAPLQIQPLEQFLKHLFKLLQNLLCDPRLCNLLEQGV